MSPDVLPVCHIQTRHLIALLRLPVSLMPQMIRRSIQRRVPWKVVPLHQMLFVLPFLIVKLQSSVLIMLPVFHFKVVLVMTRMCRLFLRHCDHPCHRHHCHHRCRHHFPRTTTPVLTIVLTPVVRLCQLTRSRLILRAQAARRLMNVFGFLCRTSTIFDSSVIRVLNRRPQR